MGHLATQCPINHSYLKKYITIKIKTIIKIHQKRFLKKTFLLLFKYRKAGIISAKTKNKYTKESILSVIVNINYVEGLKIKHNPLLQNLFFVLVGPSLKT